jgi:Rha family phage regulatory protein
MAVNFEMDKTRTGNRKNTKRKRGLKMTTELVKLKESGQAVTTSLLIAEKFGKKHRDVLKAIKNLECSEDFGARNFAHTPYTHPQNGQEYPLYEVTKDGFSFLVLGFTGKDAAKFKEEFINAFNRVNALLQSDEYITLRFAEIQKNKINLLMQQVQQKDATIEQQTREIKAIAPKADYYDNVLQTGSDFTTTLIAKELGHSAIWLNNELHKLGVIHRIDGSWVLYAKYDGKGYTKTRTSTYVNSKGEACSSISTTWTNAGREFIHRILEKKPAIVLMAKTKAVAHG